MWHFFYAFFSRVFFLLILLVSVSTNLSTNTISFGVWYFDNSENIALSTSKDFPSNIQTSDIEQILEADVYIICVSDNAIATVSNQLQFENRLVVHTSGSTDFDVLDAKNKRGVFYPLQTFSKNKTVDFTEIPICLETENFSDYEV